MPTKSARWCGRPPWTLNCVYEPWTHCPVPAVENLTIVKWSHRMTWKPQHAPDTPDVVRVMTTQLHKEVGFQHVRVAETTRGAAYEVLFTPRQWVRDAAACAMAAASLRDGGFVVTHVRISDEKKRERGAALPGLNAYFPATAVALRRANSSTLFLQTATPVAFDKMGRWCDERHVALSYTRSERAEHDLWVGAAGKRSTNHSGERSSVVAQAVNAVVASRAAGFVSLRLDVDPLHCGAHGRLSWADVGAPPLRGLGRRRGGRTGCSASRCRAAAAEAAADSAEEEAEAAAEGTAVAAAVAASRRSAGAAAAAGAASAGAAASRARAALADQIVELRRQRGGGKLSEETHRVVLGSIAANLGLAAAADGAAGGAASGAASGAAGGGAPPAATGGAPPAGAGGPVEPLHIEEGKALDKLIAEAAAERDAYRDAERRAQAEIAAAEAETERLRSELQARLRAKGAAELQADGVKWW